MLRESINRKAGYINLSYLAHILARKETPRSFIKIRSTLKSALGVQRYLYHLKDFLGSTHFMSYLYEYLLYICIYQYNIKRCYCVVLYKNSRKNIFVNYKGRDTRI
ncbi:hypothetical protein NEAUS03_0163 [Nematocida ausubeli]|nr:hypothetical protein NEAUS03_0163 [Nematocida ausubeli]